MKWIDQKYEVIRSLGGGAFSDVFLVKAKDPDAEEVALKLLKSDITLNPTERNLICFKNEFTILKNLSHPNIAQILDFGFDAELMQYYFTTEYVEGSDIFNASNDIDIKYVVDYFVQALRALEYLHAYRIFHFDIKAANLLVTNDGRLKLIDFGLASLDPKGTPSYMSPEIILGERPDGRADIYSLGVLWYFCLARKNPFRTGDPKKTIDNQKMMILPPVSKYNAEVPAYVDQILKRMLEKRPEKRYERASQVIQDLNLLGNLNIETETSETLLSYIPEKGRFIGRKEEVAGIQSTIKELKEGEKHSATIVVTGKVGTGKKRILEEVKYHAQINEIPCETADGHSTIETEELLKKIDDHLGAEEGIMTFMISAVDWLEATPAIIERIKNTLAKISAYSPKVSTLIVLSLDEDSPLSAEFETLATLPIHLENFNREELLDYVTNMTGLAEVPDFLLEEILRRTNGNPLFVTEIAKSLITSGELFDSRGRWREASFFDLGIDFKKIFPESLKDLLLGSTHELSDDETKIVEMLAVSGNPANTYEITTCTEIEDVSPAIEQLLRKDILIREAAYSYYFRNTLLAGYVYEELEPEIREKYHDRIASYLTEVGGAADDIAHHTGNGSDKRKAYESTLEVGDKYLKQGVGRKAIEYLELALKQRDVLSLEEEIDIDMKVGEAYLISQDYEKALELFNNANEAFSKIKEETSNINWQVDNMIKIGGTYIKLRELDRARQNFITSKALLNQIGSDAIRQLILENWEAYLALQEGDLEHSEKLYRKTREAWKALPPDKKSHITNNHLGMVYMEMGEVGKAIAIFDEDLNFFKEIKDELMIARCLYDLARAHHALTNIDEATRCFEEAAAISRKVKDLELLFCIYNGLGNIYYVSAEQNKKPEELEKSRQYYERARNLSNQLGDFKSHAAISVNIGLIESARENADLAYYELYPAILYLRNTAQKSLFDWHILFRGELELTKIFVHKGDLKSAQETSERTKEAAGHIQQERWVQFHILYDDALIFRELGEEEKFHETIEQLRTLVTDDKDAADIAKLTGEKIAREDDMEKSYHAILEINKMINSEESLSSVLKQILIHAIDLVSAESAAVVLKNPMGELNIAAHQTTRDLDFCVDISHAFAKEAIKTGEIIETDNALSDPRFSAEQSVKNLNLKSLICLPIFVKKQVIGALYLDSRSKEGAFRDIPKDILRTFTDQIGIAIDKARKLEDLSEKSRAMEGKLEEMNSQIKHYSELMEESVHGFITEQSYENIVGRSKPMSDILQTIDKIVDTDISVLITGESGTGKELIARALHFNSRRKKARFVTINCGAIPSNLIESELFGYKAGAFTGANQDKKGLFEEANDGTIFLDEVSEIEPALQVKLLRVIQEKELTRIGDTKPRSCDVRIISATNKDIKNELAEGRFREDLYWRICQIRLHIPPLRDRREDIPLLVKHFLNRETKGEKKIDPELLKHFMDYNWPGNIRELESLMSVAAALAPNETIDDSCVPHSYGIYQHITGTTPSYDTAPPTPEQQAEISIDPSNRYQTGRTWREYEGIILAKAYQASDFRARQAAKDLGVAPTTMYNKIKALDLDNRENPLYSEPFHYTRGHTLKSYIKPIFEAALKATNGRAYQTISNLGISQGFFYKVMKKK